MKKLLVFICLALCMMLLVCSCGGNTDTNTDTTKETVDNTDTSIDTNTNTDTDTNTDTGSTTPDNSDIIIDDNLYKVFVCDEEGNGLSNVFVQYCKDDLCNYNTTDENGYVVLPSGEYHVSFVQDLSGTYPQITYDASNYPVFEGDSKVITVILTK